MNKRDQIVKKYFSDIGKMGGSKTVETHGKDYMRELSRKAVEERKRRARMRKPVVNLDDPEKNCKVCGFDHAYISEWNRDKYAKAHEAHLLKGDNNDNDHQQ